MLFTTFQSVVLCILQTEMLIKSVVLTKCAVIFIKKFHYKKKAGVSSVVIKYFEME